MLIKSHKSQRVPGVIVNVFFINASFARSTSSRCRIIMRPSDYLAPREAIRNIPNDSRRIYIVLYNIMRVDILKNYVLDKYDLTHLYLDTRKL